SSRTPVWVEPSRTCGIIGSGSPCFYARPAPRSITTSAKEAEEGDSSPQEQSVLSDRKWRKSRRPVRELHPHRRTVRRQYLRLSDRLAAARRRTEGEPVTMDALELSRHS